MGASEVVVTVAAAVVVVGSVKSVRACLPNEKVGSQNAKIVFTK